jgi:hypothetical protein
MTYKRSLFGYVDFFQRHVGGNGSIAGNWTGWA